MMKLVGDKNAFDAYEPSNGHEERFDRKLNDAFGKKNKDYRWLKVAASILVVVSCCGLWFLSQPIKDNMVEVEDLKEDDIPIEEAELYYKQSFENQMDLLATHSQSIEAKVLIEESQLMVDTLDMQYKQLEIQLKETGDQRVAAAMINNYKSRIKILETLIQQLKYVNHLKEENHENNAS